MNDRIVILEGMPKSGKTSIVNYLSSKGIYIVDEICLDGKEVVHGAPSSQGFYIKNDEFKIKKCYDSPGIVVMDRGPISTLAYNLAKFGLDKEHSFFEVFNWFNDDNVLNFYDNVLVVYLKGRCSPTVTNADDPYGSLVNLKKLEDITLGLLKVFNIKYRIFDYDYKSEDDFRNIINEIIN